MAIKRVKRAVRRGATKVREIVVARTAPMARRVSQSRVVRRVLGESGSRRRRVARAVVSTGGAVALAQARILPAALGGYGVAKVERWQRVEHAKGIGGTNKKSEALIVNPTTRLLVELAALAVVASRTQGMLKEAACGGAGGVGALYEIYSSTDGTNPDDSFLKKVQEGGDGI